MESMSQKETENEIYTIVKDMDTYYRRHTVPVTSFSEDKYVPKKVIFWKQRTHQKTESEVLANVLGHTN